MRAMPAARAPFTLEPTFHERPWGVSSLSPWFDAPPGRRCGEAWFSARDNPTSLGASLGALIDEDPQGVLGTGAFPGREPLLLKFLFTAGRLSVQVHPDDEYARRHHRSAGKTEAWHVLRADPAAELGLGFTRRLTPDEAREAARTGAIEQLVAWRPAAAGDTFLVPAGTVHAIGSGLTLVEIQEPSDVTYRLYDYGRPRELHLEHGFTVADLGPYAIENRRTPVSEGREILARCGFFTIERVEVRGQRRFDTPAPFYHLIVVAEGSGTLDDRPFRPGSVFLAPASSPAFDVVSGSAVLLVAYTADALTTAVA
jgi:mannose-6-phosphate isomerase